MNRFPNHEVLGRRIPDTLRTRAVGFSFSALKIQTWAVLGVVLAVLARPAAPQDRSTPSVSARFGGAFHVAGLERSRRDRSAGSGPLWRHRVQPASAVGATVSLPALDGLLRARLDVEMVPHADIRRDPNGPPLYYPTSGKSYWIALSGAAAPRRVCPSRCVVVAGGVGRGFYDYAVEELRGDIGNLLAPPQHVTVGRIGIDVRLPAFRRLFVLSMSDYFGRLLPSNREFEQLSTLHTLIVSGGVALGR